MARDRSLSVKLRADVSNYLAGMKQAGSATREFSNRAGEGVAKHKADWAAVGQTVTVAGLAIAAGVGYAVSRFADFDQAMSAASAATRATSRDLAALRDAAMQAGADTQYSATEAAQAITELGKAGLSTADILDGGLTGALSLAAAGQMDVAKAAELSAIAMKQFRLGGDQVSHVADLLAAGAGKAVGSVEDMGMALKQSGLVAAQTGVSIEETTGTLAAFASAGLIGSDAGTSFKTMLQRLNPQSKEAADAMEALGISAYDSKGEFVGMSVLAGQLKGSLSKLSAEQRNAALSTIFGSDAVRAAAVLYDQGSDGIAKWTRDVNDSGFAADQAARLTDNLRGDIERLGGSLDTALIKSGSGANDALRGLSQGLESAVNWFSRLPAPVQTGAVQVGAASAAVLLLGGVVLTAIPKIQAFKVAMADMGLTAQLSSSRVATAAKSIGILTAAAAGLSVAYAGMQGVVNDWAGANDDAVKSLDALLKGGTRAEGVTMLMRDGFNDLGASVERVFNESLWIRGTNLLDGIMFLDGSNAGSSIAFFQQLDKALSGFVSSGKADQAAEIFKRVTDEASRQGIPLARLQEAFPQYAAALEKARIAQDGMRESTSPTVVAVEDYLKAATSATEATKAYADALKGFASPVLDAREANRKWQESIAEAEKALKSNGKTLTDSTDKGRDNARALDAMTTAAIDNVGAMQANGASQATLQASLETSRQRIEAMAVRFGMTKEEARKYAEQVLSIPAARATQISADTSQATEAIKGLFNYWSSKTITLRVAAQQDRVEGRATGGLITGPGTGTSDSIPALLSNGEYVIKAAAVDYYGVEKLHAINAMRFADGGLVGAQRTSVNASVSLPSDGWALSGSLNIGGQLVPLIDARISRADRALVTTAQAGRRTFA